MYPRRTSLALSHIKLLLSQFKFIILCRKLSDPFDTIARNVKYTHNKPRTYLLHLILYDLLYSPHERMAS
jgi:hypothetical protein